MVYINGSASGGTPILTMIRLGQGLGLGPTDLPPPVPPSVPTPITHYVVNNEQQKLVIAPQIPTRARSRSCIVIRDVPDIRSDPVTGRILAIR